MEPSWASAHAGRRATRPGAGAVTVRAAAAVRAVPFEGGGAGPAPACGTADTGSWNVETECVSTSSRR